MDSSTVSLMKKPRCGVPDQSGSKLQKRYSTEVPWRIRDLTYYVQPGGDLPAVSTIKTEYGNREGHLQMCEIHISKSSRAFGKCEFHLSYFWTFLKRKYFLDLETSANVFRL